MQVYRQIILFNSIIYKLSSVFVQVVDKWTYKSIEK